MKKEDIIIVRIVSAAGIFAALALLLIFGLGSGLFSDITAGINNGTLDTEALGISVYSLYYYKGVNVIYHILFSVALFATVITAVGFILKYRGSVIIGKIASIISVVTGVYVILCNIFEQNNTVVGFVAGFYLENSGDNMQLANVLGLRAVIVSVIMIILGVLVFVLIKAGDIGRMKMFHVSSQAKYFKILIPVIYGAVVLETVRELVIGICAKNGSAMTSQVYTFIKDYYFADSWGFNISYVWFLVLIAVMFVVLGRKFIEKTGALKITILAVVVLTLVATVRSAVFLANPPRLFGYLTLDELLCDATEAAYPLYMVLFATDIILLAVILCVLYMFNVSAKKILILCGVHLSISIVAVLVLINLSLAAVYAGCIIVNIVALIACFYIANISRSNKRVVGVVDNEAGL